MKMKGLKNTNGFGELGTERSILEKHGKWMLAAVVFLALGFGGAQYYSQYQTKQTIKVSAVYDEMLFALQKQDKALAREKGEILLKQGDRTPYAALGALMLAKLDIEAEDLSAAKEHLAVKHFQNAPLALQAVAKVRLARVLAAEKNYDEALNVLNEENPPGFETLFDEAKGDIYLLQNQKEKASKAFQAAIMNAPQGVPVWRMQIKQTELGMKKEES